MKKPIGIVIIAVCFSLQGIYGIYNFINFIINNGELRTSLLALFISICFIVSGVGLYLLKGWGRNFAFFVNSYVLFHGIGNLIRYFIIGNKLSFIFKGTLDILVAAVIFMYLSKKDIASTFPKGPVSLIFLGFCLSAYGINQHTGNALTDYMLVIIAIIGFAILANGARQLRSNAVEVK